jgi:NitT/TauT family transport system substrate-binding protein
MHLTVSENFHAVFYAPFYALQALDFAAREGLHIKWLRGDRPGGAIGAVKRGDIDAMFGGPMRVLHDHDGPVDETSLLNFAEVVGRDPFYLIGRKRDAFKLKDLAAMRVGIVSEVPTPWYCLRADLEEAGVDTSAMQLVRGLTMAQQLEALRAGELDAAQLFEPYVTQALEGGKAAGHAVLYAASSRGPCVYTTFICSRGSAAKRRAEFAALTRATQATLDWIAEKGPAELARVTASRFPDLPAEVLAAALARYHAAGIWSRDATVSEAGFERLAHSMQSGGFIAKRASYSECVENFG